MTCDVTLWTQNNVTSQKMEYLRRLFLYRTETLYSCCNQHKVSWYFYCDISMATQWAPGPLHLKEKIRVFLLQEELFALVTGYSKDQLNNLFNSLVMSVFLYGIEVWGAAYQRKYLDRIDRFLKRAHRFGFVTKKTTILDLIKDRDSKLFKNVIRDDHILHDLLPPKRKRVLRERKHDFIFPRVKTERFKQSFLNRCIFY